MDASCVVEGHGFLDGDKYSGHEIINEIEMLFKG